ncbi:MAG: SigE family RNA polymerase sigma factor [Acidimicrobiales bacterium]
MTVSGDFDRFVRASAARLTRSVFLVTWDLGEAEDVVQEALSRSARRWPRIRRMEHPYSYVRRIAVNLALTGADARARRSGELSSGQGELEAAAAGAGGELSAVEDRLDLVELLSRLSVRQRAVVVLRYVDDLSEAEAAETLGWPVGTVKSTSARALGLLRAGYRRLEAIDCPAVRTPVSSGPAPAWDEVMTDAKGANR